MTQHEKKQRAARAALAHIPPGAVLGIGSGSTVGCFIEALGDAPAALRARVRGAVAASQASERLLRAQGIELVDLNQVHELPLYVDGADEANPHKHLLKGGGGAMVREKIIAAASRRFLCILDDGKLVAALGRRPVPVEVLPLARSMVARRFATWGLRPEWRRDFVSDNGNQILDVYGCHGRPMLELEERLDRVPGVVGHGLFVCRPADTLLVADDRGVREVD